MELMSSAMAVPRARQVQDDEDDDMVLLAKLLREEEDRDQESLFASDRRPDPISTLPKGFAGNDGVKGMTRPHGVAKRQRVESSAKAKNRRRVVDQEEEEDWIRVTDAVVPIRRPKIYNDNDLFRSLQLMDFESVQALLEHDRELVSARDEDFAQPLAVAVEARFERGVKFLLHLKCSLLEVDGRGYSALHLAVEVFADMPFLLRYLLQHGGMDINARASPSLGPCPLHLASGTRALRLLLACGADPTVPAQNEREGSEGGNVLAWVERTWPQTREKTKARFMLACLSPYHSFVLAKLCFISRMYAVPGGAGAAPAANPCTGARSARFPPSPSLVAVQPRPPSHSLTHRIGAMIANARLDGQTEEVNPLKDDEHSDEVWCREEVSGQIFSFVQDGRLYLARSGGGSRAPPVVPRAPPARPPYFPAAPLPGASRGSRETTKGDQDRSGAAASPTMCPLSALRAAQAEVFPVGLERGEGKILSAPENGAGRSRSNPSQFKEGRGCWEGEEWLCLPPLPRVTVVHPPLGKTDSHLDLAAGVLHALVHEMGSEEVLDTLRSMLWSGGGGRAGFGGGPREGRGSRQKQGKECSKGNF